MVGFVPDDPIYPWKSFYFWFCVHRSGVSGAGYVVFEASWLDEVDSVYQDLLDPKPNDGQKRVGYGLGRYWCPDLLLGTVASSCHAY